MNKKMWLKAAAGLSFFMAICQSIISISPAAIANFQNPPLRLENRLQLFLGFLRRSSPCIKASCNGFVAGFSYDT